MTLVVGYHFMSLYFVKIGRICQLVAPPFQNTSQFPINLVTLRQVLRQKSINFVLKLNYRKMVFFSSSINHLFARDILLMKKLEIEEAKIT